MTQLDLATLPPPAAPGSAASPVEAGQTGDDLKLKPVSGLVRALVYLTDLACVFAVTGLLWWLFPSPVLAGITIAEAIVVLTLFRARTGRTPGALATGTAAVAHGSNHAPGLGKQLVRSILMTLLHVTAVGPLVGCFMSRDGRDWVDRISGTAMVNLRTSAEETEQDKEEQDKETVEEEITEPRQGQGFPDLQQLPVSPESSVPAPAPTSPVAPAPSPPRPSPFYPGTAVPPPDRTQKPSPPATSWSRAGVPQESPAPATRKEGPATRKEVRRDTGAPPPRGGVTRLTWDWGGPPEPPAPSASPPRRAAASQDPAPAAPSSPAAAPAGPLSPRRAAAHSPQTSKAEPSTVTRRVAGPNGLPRATFLWVVVDSGQKEKVDAALVIGREPSTSTAGERLIAVPDSTNSISRTHLRLGPARNGVWVEDASSTNGTALRAADGKITLLEPGRRILVPAGTMIIMGKRTMTIMGGAVQ